MAAGEVAAALAPCAPLAVAGGCCAAGAHAIGAKIRPTCAALSVKLGFQRRMAWMVAHPASTRRRSRLVHCRGRTPVAARHPVGTSAPMRPKSPRPKSGMCLNSMPSSAITTTNFEPLTKRCGCGQWPTEVVARSSSFSHAPAAKAARHPSQRVRCRVHKAAKHWLRRGRSQVQGTRWCRIACRSCADRWPNPG